MIIAQATQSMGPETQALVTLAIQFVGLILIIGTVIVYWFQFRVMQGQLTAVQKTSESQNLLHLSDFLGSPEMRAAREVVLGDDLANKSFTDWSDQEKKHASTAIASYHVAAVLVERGLVPSFFVVDLWGPSIRRCYDISRPLILARREINGPDYWGHIEGLYNRIPKFESTSVSGPADVTPAASNPASP